MLSLRTEHPAWGGRKIAGGCRIWATKPCRPPRRSRRSCSGTVSNWARMAAVSRAYTRFERARPNELWQMDFKGHVAAGTLAGCIR